MTYSFLPCKVCPKENGQIAKTAHCKPSAQSPHYCMRHEGEKIRRYDMADRMADLRSMIKPFAMWAAVTVGRN